MALVASERMNASLRENNVRAIRIDVGQSDQKSEVEFLTTDHGYVRLLGILRL